MALIRCPECQGEVSDQAASCPHCGYPVHKATTVSAPPLDDTLRQLLTQGKKIAAVKLYREHHPAASLSAAKAHVDRLEAALPAALRPAGAGTCLLLLCLLLMSAPVVATWAWAHKAPARMHAPLPPAAHR